MSNKEVDTSHYDVFQFGDLRVDPYFVADLWKTGEKDPSGCLNHIMKTIARFGVKDGNSVMREIHSIKATIARLEQLHIAKEELVRQKELSDAMREAFKIRTNDKIIIGPEHFVANDVREQDSIGCSDGGLVDIRKLNIR